MKAFSDFKSERQAATEQLAIGGYVLKILNAEVKNYDSGSSQLVVSFDICEGNQKDYYKNNYENQTYEDKKWKGNYKLWIPKDDGTEMDEWSKKKFGDFIACVEDSNSGYHWDWDEKKLKGKLIGGLFRNEQWAWNGKSGWTVKMFKPMSAQEVREGKFTMPKDKPLKNQPVPAIPEIEEVANDVELPWD